MDPLSALRMMVSPELRAKINSAGEAGASGVISQAELEKAGGLRAPSGPPPVAPHSFESVLGNFVGEVAHKQAAAGDAVNGLISGQNVSLHQAMISMEEANVSFQLMVEVRNKLLESYQELM